MNVLYVLTQGSSVLKEGETLVVRVADESRMRVPVHTLSAVVTFGQVWCSPPMLGLCAERGVSVAFLTEHGRFLARVEGTTTGNVLLRRAQYRWADSEQSSARIARHVVLGKLANSRSVLLRGARESSDDSRRSALSAAAEHIERMSTSLREDTPLDSVRGCEGDCSREYFAAFDRLLLPIDGAFRFQGRSRRPPLDPVNAALSFAYSLLVTDVQAALETVGLDPQVGFLHRDRPGRSGLALDLAEEHRSWLADRLVLSLINRRQLAPDDFNFEPTGAVFLKEDARKTVIRSWAQRKLEETQHPFLREKMPIGLMLHMQARVLAKHVRGDLDGYPPFLWK